jgi:hypothetical protein
VNAKRQRKHSSYSILTSALDVCEWSGSRPGRALPQGKIHRYALDRSLGGGQSWSGQRLEEKLSDSAGDRTTVVHSYCRPISMFFFMNASLITSTLNVLSPNVIVKWLTLLLRIQEVPGSNLSPDTGYHDWGFLWFSSVTPGECCDIVLKLVLGRFLRNPC